MHDVKVAKLCSSRHIRKVAYDSVHPRGLPYSILRYVGIYCNTPVRDTEVPQVCVPSMTHTTSVR